MILLFLALMHTTHADDLDDFVAHHNEMVERMDCQDILEKFEDDEDNAE